MVPQRVLGALVTLAGFTALEWLALAERELLLFAGVFFLLGALDEFAVDLAWLWLKLTKRIRTSTIEREEIEGEPLAAGAAVFIPAWNEEAVIGHTVRHALAAWPHEDMRLYVGCYSNDAATVTAVAMASGGDPRLRVVILEQPGPTTKADCLNGLYAAMERDERRSNSEFGFVVLHDAEDMVDPAALNIFDLAMEHAEFVQLPVLPEPHKNSRWIGSHYCEEFAEAHGKAMVVRDALSAGLPAAGVGCAFERGMLAKLAAEHPVNGGPFSPESLTEDYELGLRIKALGGDSAFVRVRDQGGRLVATRAFFPDALGPAVRQKTRWVHGIAFQSWERLGWSFNPIEFWMRARDRRGPLTALVLASGYLLLAIAAILGVASLAGYSKPWKPDPFLDALILTNLASFALRALMRFAFTAREYGVSEGIRAVLRIPVANVIAIMAGRRAFFAYLRTLAGGLPKWDKTRHDAHPAMAGSGG